MSSRFRRIRPWRPKGARGPGQFNTPHSIAVDAKGSIYVADRGNHRIQVFDGEGNFQRQIVISVPVPPGAKPAIGNIPSEALLSGGNLRAGLTLDDLHPARTKSSAL